MLPVVFVVLTLATIAKPDWTDCPLPCRCKWTSGKKTALCSSSGLTILPNISSDIQVLDLQNNFISYLKTEAFYSIELINLQKIYMKNTTLTVIHKDAFKNLKILIEVDISDNQLTVIPRGTFSGNDRLKVIILSGNPLKELTDEQFPNLPHLRSLELENCKLQTIHSEAFIHLHQLEKLSLRKNLLSTLSEVVFQPLEKLKSLALENNPWKCDCHLRSLRNWFLLNKLHSVSLLCSEPERVKQKLWEEVKAQEFACPPIVRVRERMIQRDVGENVTLTCFAKGDPEPEVAWFFNGESVNSPNATHLEQIHSIELEGVLEKWINITLINLTDINSGEYSCIAKNNVETVSQNVSLVLPQVVTATTLSKADSYSPLIGLIVGAVATVATCIILSVICGYKKKKNVTVQRGRVKGSSSFMDQEKKLLDLSIASTAEPSPCTWNSEIIRGSDSDSRLLENSASIPLETCDPTYSYSESNQSSSIMIPMSGAYSTAVGVYPPPPEFSSGILSPSGFGNIFISVSVSQDPYSDIQRYPDLLDIPYNSSNVSNISGGSISPCSAPSVSYATLPRRPRSSALLVAKPNHDKLGPRVTVEGSSILYQSEAKEVIPPPPLPPQCSSFVTSEYVSL